MASIQRVVVLLENDETTRELYRRELGRQYQVIACSTEREAFEALRTVATDIVVLEPAALADENWTFISTVHHLEQYANLPIIVCSILDARRRGLETGADVYLVKPVTPAALAATLAAVLPFGPGPAAIASDATPSARE